MKTTPLFALAALCACLASCNPFEVTENDKRFFVTPGAFSEYDIAVPEDFGRFEKFEKTYTSYFSPQITYTYQPTDEESQIRFMTETVSFQRRFFDALLGKVAFDAFFGLALSMGNIELREEKGIYPNKYKAKVYSLIGDNGLCVGSALSARVDNTVYTFAIVGVTIPTEEVWKDLFDRKLAQFER